VATIAATMGIAVVVISLICSFEKAWLTWIGEHFGADLFVGKGQHVKLIASDVMPVALAARIAGIPGVAAVEPFRTIRTHVQGRPVFVQGMTTDSRLKRGGLSMVEGSLTEAAPALRSGSGVLLSDNLAYKLALHKGGTIMVPTAKGLRQFTIEGVYVDYLGSLDLGAVLVDQEQLRMLWNDDSMNLLRIWLTPGASVDDVKSAIRKMVQGKQIGNQSPYYILDGAGFLRGVEAAVSRFFAATWALELVAALVGVIGVVNTQLAIVLDRGAEIGVLRTIGLSRKDIIWSVVIECGALGALGGILGVILGVILGAQIVLVSLKLVTGWSMAFHVPWLQLVVAVVIATAVSAIAGYVPARAAARVRLGQTSTD
jgi:putative ABC transport system permease protein